MLIIRTKLSKLNQYMPMSKGNIKEFNKYIQLQLHSLNAKGETTNALLVHLFTAYKVASNSNFWQLARRRGKYERGEQMIAQSLMGFMLSHWEIMKNKNECEAPSHKEQQLMVMRAEIEEMKQKKSVQGQQTNLMKKLTDRVSSKIKVARKVKQAGRYKYQDDPEWLEKNTMPNPLTKVMQHRNKSWQWCSTATGGKCEGCWRVHKPSECRGTAPQRRGTTVNAGGNEQQQLHMMQALTSVLMENDDENQDDRSMEES
jgi:hypothetical protein